jgi:hypothetical protein
MPLLSIVIPTHNRAAYCEIAVRKTLLECPEAEVLVSDTSMDSGLRTRLSDLIEAGRIIYLRPEGVLSVVAHFEFALQHATGDYLMFIGDDDCVGPGLMEVTRWAARNGVDAVHSYAERLLIVYYWPGVQSKFYGSGYSARMFVSRFTGRAQQIDAEAALKRVTERVGRGLGNLPRIYHGLVARELVDRVVAKHGALFGGVSPDIYSGALIATEAQNAWHVDYPFVIPGGSPPSTAGTGAARTDKPDLWSNAHIKPFTDLRWDPLIPEFYAPYIVWAYSLARALEKIGKPGLKMRYARTIMLSLLYGRKTEGAATAAWRRYARRHGFGRAIADTAVELAREGAFQARRFGGRLLAPRAGGRAIQVGDLQSIDEAYDALTRLVADRGIELRLPACH